MSFARRELREEILYWCKESVRTGLNFNTQGNISIRLPEHDAIVITPSGIRYDVLTIDEMVVVGYDGVVIEGDLFPSTETDVHLAHYRRRPDINAIVHTESPYANMFGAVGKTIDPVLLNMVLYAKGAVRIMPFEFSTNKDFGELSAALMGDDTNAVVWGNHGMISVGEDVAGAFKVAVAVEANAQVLYGALQLGTPNILELDKIVIPEGARLP
ncbi:class II aldolase/adducin family protein [Cryobacterium zhongshanensis]|uniref:Class II aldolase/adducin family protein n=1 Tax=Cryobacterium zhongshanensis TaxID=2928153 RepID=A0AA41QWR8_9MICO|nr:class II aldolase/adducin family protein [Cryobacterium zhongshanensis]MCI4659177.1 class II aldolase/adducin family protein [Cryobacterium zhongshanensis]